MKKILLSFSLLFAFVTMLRAQCREYRVLNQFHGTTISEAKLTVCGDEVLYERIQKTEQKKVGYVTTYLYFENVRHYYNNATQEHIVQRILSDGTKLISRFTSDPLNWELSEGETRTINGAVCQKAVLRSSESDYVKIAWYAPDIPISFGPHDFMSHVAFLYGLPGLIMGIGYEGQLGGFEILLADEKNAPERTLKPNWDGIEVPRQLIEKTYPPKSEVKKYKKTSE